MEKPLYMKLLYLSGIVSIVVWLAVLLNTNHFFGENRFTGYEIVKYNEGWTDEVGNEVLIPGKQKASAGETFRLYHTVSEAMEEPQCLLFRTDHTFVRAYVNGKEVYSFGREEEILFGKTPGSGWQLVELGMLKQGEVITLELTCPYEKYSGLMRDILIGDKSELTSYIMWKGMVMFIMVLIPFLIGLVIVIFPPIFFRQYPAELFWNVGFAFITISVWSFTEARSWQLYFVNNYAMQILNFLTFALFVPEVMVALKLLGFIADTRLFRVMMTINLTADLAMIVLQVLEIADFFETLPMVHVLLVVNGVIFITAFIRQRQERNRLIRILSYGLYLVIAAAAVLDIADFYIWDYFGNGFFSRMIILVMLLCTMIISTRRALALHYENIEKEAIEKMAYTDALTELRNRRGFDQDIEQLTRQEQAITIVYADMNGLKYINDNLGHRAGDEGIMILANTLKRFFGAQAECYRIGGDEFCVLSGEMSEQEAEVLCHRVDESLRQYREKFSYPIGIAYGISRYEPEKGLTMFQCLSAADQRMYAHKEEIYRTRKKYR